MFASFVLFWHHSLSTCCCCCCLSGASSPTNIGQHRCSMRCFSTFFRLAVNTAHKTTVETLSLSLFPLDNGQWAMGNGQWAIGKKEQERDNVFGQYIIRLDCVRNVGGAFQREKSRVTQTLLADVCVICANCVLNEIYFSPCPRLRRIYSDWLLCGVWWKSLVGFLSDSWGVVRVIGRQTLLKRVWLWWTKRELLFETRPVGQDKQSIASALDWTAERCMVRIGALLSARYLR